MPRIILLQETPSTNDFLKRTAQSFESGTMIVAYRQTAGRGQKGNSWEAEPGKNVTFSILLKNPRIGVKEQFVLSEAVSLAIVDVLENYAEGFKVKWPNDIYYGDCKICGILIENSLGSDAIDYSIVGVGLNVNQHFFTSGAPNPISLHNITGENYELGAMNDRIGAKIEEYCTLDGSHSQIEAMHQRYLEKLYRNDGKPHQFITPQGELFDAVIHGVALDGTLTLRHVADDTLHDYRFKEVGFVINKKQFL